MKARVAMQMSSNEAIKQAVMAGMGVSLLAKTLSPVAEAFRCFILERGELFLAEQFGRHDVSHAGAPLTGEV